MPTQLTLETVPLVAGGRVALAFDKAAKAVIDDCLSRPAMANARSVVLKMIVKPKLNDQGQADDVIVAFDVTPSIPGMKTDEYPMMLHRNGTVSFEPDNPSNPRQPTMFGPED